MIKLKTLVLSLLINLLGGGIVAFFTTGEQSLYKNLKLPPLSPPSYIFPIVWSVLYILMAVSAYIVYESESSIRDNALYAYAAQLIVNFIWPLIFFNTQMYWFSFFWLIGLIVLVLITMNLFYKIKPKAAYLQIPYLLWLIFAGYLNFMVAIMN